MAATTALVSGTIGAIASWSIANDQFTGKFISVYNDTLLLNRETFLQKYGEFYSTLFDLVISQPRKQTLSVNPIEKQSIVTISLSSLYDASSTIDKNALDTRIIEASMKNHQQVFVDKLEKNWSSSIETLILNSTKIKSSIKGVFMKNGILNPEYIKLLAVNSSDSQFKRDVISSVTSGGLKTVVLKHFTDNFDILGDIDYCFKIAEIAGSKDNNTINRQILTKTNSYINKTLTLALKNSMISKFNTLINNIHDIVSPLSNVGNDKDFTTTFDAYATHITTNVLSYCAALAQKDELALLRSINTLLKTSYTTLNMDRSEIVRKVFDLITGGSVSNITFNEQTNTFILQATNSQFLQMIHYHLNEHSRTIFFSTSTSP